jgi:hypothetical protein
MKAIETEGDISINLERFEVDPQITYPSYKSFDEFIDVERLRSLDAYIADGIKRHIQTQKEDYFINYYRLDDSLPYQPGVREIWLSRTKPGTPYDYLDLDQTDLWERTEAAAEFSLLMDFIETLAFQNQGQNVDYLRRRGFDGSGAPRPRRNGYLSRVHLVSHESEKTFLCFESRNRREKIC